MFPEPAVVSCASPFHLFRPAPDRPLPADRRAHEPVELIPGKSAAELREIETKFYRHLSEVFVDTIKLATISRKEILERMVYRDVEAQEEAMRGRNWISAMSHYGSWELTINYACHSDHWYWPSTARCTARRSTSSTTKPDPVSARSRFR